ncbi:MAG TPA: hypothetical protein VIY72_06165, partial [Acidimicrobiales bacterium]
MSRTALPSDLEGAAERSAAPASVRAALAHLLERAPAAIDRVRDDVLLANRLVAVLAASRSLTRQIDADPLGHLDVLAALDQRPPVHDDTA